MDLDATLTKLLRDTALPAAIHTDRVSGLGMDNALLRATLSDGHQVLLRQGAASPSPLQRARFLAHHDVGAPRMWAADDDGASLVDYVPGQTLVAAAENGTLDDSTWRRVGLAYARVHAVRFPAPLCGPYEPGGLHLAPADPVQTLQHGVNEAAAWVERERPALAPLLDVLRGRIEARAEALRREVPCLTQNDANFHNIIVGQDEVTLIDWDFPAVRYPLEELAGLEGHAYLYGFPELPRAFFDGYGLPVSAPLLRLHRIVGDLRTLSSPGWAHMISGAGDLTPPIVAMIRRFYSGWSAWFDDLPEHVQST